MQSNSNKIKPYQSMLNLTKNFALLFFVVITFISCTKTYNDEYATLSVLIECNPQAALDSVCSLIRKNNEKDEYTRNKFALLKYEAEIKCNIEHNSDSTIKEILSYMTKNGSVGDKIAANYCIGIRYANTKQLPLAMTHLNEVISLSESNPISKPDSICVANAHMRLGRMNANLELYSTALYHTRKALEIKKSLNTDDVLAYQSMANVFYANNKIDSAQILYKKCAMDIVCENTIKDNLKSIGEQLYFFSRTNNAKMAKMSLEQIKTVDIDSLPSEVLSNIVQYYIHIELNTDSCIYYNKLAYDKERDYDLKANKAKNLSILYAYLNDYEKYHEICL